MGKNEKKMTEFGGNAGSSAGRRKSNLDTVCFPPCRHKMPLYAHTKIYLVQMKQASTK